MASAQQMIIEGEDFRRLQQLELEMMVEVDRVCRKHDIPYGIIAGTLLGAVRHKGFIPWDDDIDIAFMRENYERFRAVAHELNPDICWFQDHNTDPDYPWGYGKIRHSNTQFVRLGQDHLKFKTGVPIDVFPLDDIPKSRFGQWAQDKYCFCLRKMLYADIARVDERYSKPMRVWWTLLSKIPREWVHNRIWGMAKHSRNDSDNYMRVLMFSTPKQTYREADPDPDMWYGCPKSWGTDLVDYEFEGHKFLGLRDYESNLKMMYGDWRQLPPEDKRDPHNAVSYYEFPD